jgi:hypothetical protein
MINLLIKLSNKFSKYLIKRLYNKKIHWSLYWKLSNPFNDIDIEFAHCSPTQLNIRIITEKELSLDEDLKIIQIITNENDKCKSIHIETDFYTQEQYNRDFGGDS